jgi:hypothetical protein
LPPRKKIGSGQENGTKTYHKRLEANHTTTQQQQPATAANRELKRGEKKEKKHK